jgi:AraC family transcriptional regulator
MPTPPRGLWIGRHTALFDHRCTQVAPGAATEFFVSAPCVVLVRRGAFRTSSALGEHLADPGTAVFRNALAGYAVHDIPDAPHAATTLRISIAAFREMLAPVDSVNADQESPAFRRGTALPTPSAQLLHASIIQELSRPTRHDDLLLEESTLHLAATMVHAAYQQPRPTRPAVTARAKECASAAGEFIARHAVGPITLKDIAAASGCSEWHLARSFAAITETTIHRHLTTIRLRMGLERVLGSAEGMTQIAAACGFADHSHFTSAFHREYGMPPSQARGLTLAQVLERVS